MNKLWMTYCHLPPPNNIMYFLWIVWICKLEAYPLRWIMVVLFYFMYLAFLLRTALVLHFIVVNAKEVSFPLCLLKENNPVLVSNILATSVYPLFRHFYWYNCFGSISQKLESKETEFLWSRFMIQYEKFLYFEMQSQSQEGFDVRMFLNHFLEKI